VLEHNDEVLVNALRSVIADRSKSSAENPFLLSANGDRILTYEELEESNSVTIDALQDWGIRPGDRIGLVIADPILSSQTLLAMISMGLWVAPLDPTIAYSSASQVDERGLSLGRSRSSLQYRHFVAVDLRSRVMDYRGVQRASGLRGRRGHHPLFVRDYWHTQGDGTPNATTSRGSAKHRAS
jgi:hypothetical protein